MGPPSGLCGGRRTQKRWDRGAGGVETVGADVAKHFPCRPVWLSDAPERDPARTSDLDPEGLSGSEGRAGRWASADS